MNGVRVINNISAIVCVASANVQPEKKLLLLLFWWIGYFSFIGYRADISLEAYSMFLQASDCFIFRGKKVYTSLSDFTIFRLMTLYFTGK